MRPLNSLSLRIKSDRLKQYRQTPLVQKKGGYRGDRKGISWGDTIPHKIEIVSTKPYFKKKLHKKYDID